VREEKKTMLDKKRILGFFVKHRERTILTGTAILMMAFIVIGVIWQRHNRAEAEKKEQKVVEKVDLKVEHPENVDDDSGKNQKKTYLLTPSPEELLSQLTSMENLNDDVAEKKFTGLRVLWKVYFFSRDDAAGGETVLFDVSDDGFGTLVQTVVKAADFPEFATMTRGTPIWLGGEIQAVDLSGTGTIHLKTEQVKSSKEIPLGQDDQAPPPE
jgi:hypothetical protein